eukprot:15327960-Ditylum_brightwellii.AAC.1
MMQKQANQLKSDDTDGKPKCNKKFDKNHHYYSKQDLNTIIVKSIKDILKKTCHHQCDNNDKEENAINKFDGLSVSSSDNSSDEDKKRST